MALGWIVGLLAGALGLLLGLFLLRVLVRAGVSWWSTLLGPALLFGPALGLLLGGAARIDFVDGGLDFGWNARALWAGGEAGWATLLAWSLIVFFGVTTVYGLVRAFLASDLVRQQLGVRIPSIVLDAARVVLWVVMVFVVVGGIWGRTEWFSALFTASAVGTVILGLALQETLVNFFAGVGIVNERTFAIGDWIWVGEDEGEVVSLSRRATKIRNRTSDIVTIPNRVVMTTKVRNQSQPTAVHAEFVFVQAPYETPPNRVRTVLRAAVAEVPKVLRDPPPVFRVFRFGDSGIEYQVKIFVTDMPGVPDIKSDVSAQIWYHLKRADISIPYPVREYRRFSPTGILEDSAEGIRRTLATNAFFAALPADLVESVAQAAEMTTYGAGERVVQQGASGDSCYVVRSGHLAVTVTDGEVERQVATLREGDLFGEMSLLTGEPRSATVRAEEDSRLVRVHAAGLRTALERSPDLAHHLAETAALRKEGLLEARAALDAAARERVRAATVSLGELIRRFFRLPDTSPPRPR